MADAAPAFFDNAAIRRRDLAWNDWTGVCAFLEDQAVCRLAAVDAPSPYVAALSYRFEAGAFLVHFSRNGTLAKLLAIDPHVTIEVSQAISLLKAPAAQNTSMEYRSVIARCVAKLTLLDLEIEAQQYDALEKYRPERDYLPIDRERATRAIVACRAEIVSLSAKKRVLADGQFGASGIDPGYARYEFPAPPALSSLPPEAFKPR